MRYSPTISLFGLLSCILASLAFASASWASEGEVKVRPSQVVLVVIDTLRSDVLPFYGGDQDTAPFLDSLAESGLVMLNNFSTSSWTAPGTASILTGLYPHQHGVMMGRNATRRMQKVNAEAKLNKIPESVTTIAEMLRSEGYETFGIADNGNIREDAGFAQGFDEFRTYTNQGADVVLDAVFDWSPRIQEAERSFLYLQFMDPHHPYLKRRPFYKAPSARDAVSKLRAAYKSEVRYVDEALGKLSSHFGWKKDALVLVTSDHGEEFHDHGGMGHGKTLYSEVVRVPFLLFMPEAEFAGEAVEHATSVIDILPTLADVLEIDLDFYREGRSVLELREEEDSERYLFSQLWKETPAGKEVLMYSAQDGKHRFLSQSVPNPHRGFYDLQEDPREKRNLIESHPESAQGLEARYFEYEESEQKYPREWAETNLLLDNS